MKIARSLQSLSGMVISVSWLNFLLTGTQPSVFVSTVWATVGAVVMILLGEFYYRVIA